MKTAAMLSPEPAVEPFKAAPSARPSVRPPFPTSPRPYAKAKFDWIDQISLDTELTDFQVRVGVRIARRHNMTNGYAHPSHKNLAEDIGAKGTTGIKAAIDALVRRDHLHVEYSRGAGNANRYFLIRKGKLKQDHFPSETDPKKVHGHPPLTMKRTRGLLSFSGDASERSLTALDWAGRLTVVTCARLGRLPSRSSPVLRRHPG
jgi:hypothetical protein